jgi:hypothetical protein
VVEEGSLLPSRKPSALQLALATIAPLLFWFAPLLTMLFGDRYGWRLLPFLLVGWCVILLGSAVWLNHALFPCRKTLFPFLAIIMAILSIWSWQRQAFNALVPSGQLTWGFFLKPEGAHAHRWVLTCPFWTGVFCFIAFGIVASILGWRKGARWSLACMIPWWLAAFLIFSLLSMELDAQGNGSMFM